MADKLSVRGSLAVLPVLQRLSTLVTRVLALNPGPFTLQGTNTYIVGSGSDRILVDSGEGKEGYTALIEEALAIPSSPTSSTSATSPGNPPSIRHIICTHWHHDHVGGVRDVMKMSTSSPALWKYPCPDRDDATLGFRPLKDGDKISVEGATMRVVFTPGHAEDHIALHLEEENAVFAGDCVLGQGTAVFEDLKDYMDSLEKLKNIAPSVLYPGHGPVVENPVELISEYIKHRMARENQVLEVLRRQSSPLSTEDLVKQVYVDLSPQLVKAACNSLNHHLQKLKREGKVHECGDAEGTVQWRSHL